MVQIPENTVDGTDLQRWYKLSSELKNLRIQEMILRKKLFGAYFPDAKEGTNNIPIGGGWTLKGKRNITRTIDEPSLRGMLNALSVVERTGEEAVDPTVRLFVELGIRPEKMVRNKPELNKREYNKLSDIEKYAFDNLLKIKDGSPGMDLDFKEPTDDDVDNTVIVDEPNFGPV